MLRHDSLRRLTRARTLDAATGCASTTAGGQGPDPYDLSYGYSKSGNLENNGGRTQTFTGPQPHAATTSGADSVDVGRVAAWPTRS